MTNLQDLNNLIHRSRTLRDENISLRRQLELATEQNDRLQERLSKLMKFERLVDD